MISHETTAQVALMAHDTRLMRQRYGPKRRLQAGVARRLLNLLGQDAFNTVSDGGGWTQLTTLLATV